MLEGHILLMKRLFKYLNVNEMC